MALAAYILWALVWNIGYRQRQRELGDSRPTLEPAEFVVQMERSGVPADLAEFIWDQVLPYYTQSLRPHPSDRINADLKIDPDDLSEIAVDYEKKFGRRFTKNPIPCPTDPSIGEFALSLHQGSVPKGHG